MVFSRLLLFLKIYKVSGAVLRFYEVNNTILFNKVNTAKLQSATKNNEKTAENLLLSSHNN